MSKESKQKEMVIDVSAYGRAMRIEGMGAAATECKEKRLAIATSVIAKEMVRRFGGDAIMELARREIAW